MQTITRKALYEKMIAETDNLAGAGWLSGGIAAAKALGYEVVEGPELPERLLYEVYGDMVTILVGTNRHLIAQLYQAEGVSREELIGRASALVSRYNAKAEVLAVADELMADYGGHAKVLAGRLRAAYRQEKP